MEPRQLLSGTGFAGFSVLRGINVDQGLHVPGRQLSAGVSLVPWQGLEGLPVTLALSKDGVVGNGDDIILGTAKATTTSWGPPVTPTTIQITTADFTVTIPASLADGTYNVVASADDGSQTVGPSITVATPKAGTDLAFGYATMFQYLWPENDSSPVASVRNDGTVNSGPWTMALYLSKDKVLGNGDDILVYSGSPANGGAGIDPADTVSAFLHFDRPSINIPDGIYYPIFVLDPQNQVAETDETNNVWMANPVLAGPHGLQVGAQSITAATRTDPGSTLSVDMTTNPTPGMAQRDLYFELLAPDGTTYRLDGTLTLPSTSGHVDLSVPADVPAGQYQLRTMCDINGMTTMVLVDDRDPATVGPTVWVGMDPIASTPTTNTPSPSPTDDPAVTVAAGSTRQVPLVVSNPHNRALRQTYNVSFYLSDDPTLSRDDRKFSSQQTATRVRPNQSQALLASFQLPKRVRLGTHYLIAVADPANPAATPTKALRRAATTNRSHPGRLRLIVPIEVTRPHLQASVRSVKAAPNHPDLARVKVRLTNTGSELLASPVTFTVLSDDSQSPGTLLTTTRPLTLETGHHKDLILLVPRPETGGFRIRVS